MVQISGADLTPELQPLPSSNILMVEVDNVQHEQFTVTEEVKVRLSSHGETSVQLELTVDLCRR